MSPRPRRVLLLVVLLGAPGIVALYARWSATDAGRETASPSPVTAERVKPEVASPPNVLVVVAEDSSWLHFSAYAEGAARTPAFDRVAEQGVLFTHAFASEPTCSPSRAAILTGQPFWRLENAAVFGGTLKRTFDTYPVLLEAAGYHTGSSGKVWSPGSWADGGWEENPGGRDQEDFTTFLSRVPAGEPFCYWHGSADAHRPFTRALTERSGKDPRDVALPPFLPDRPEVRLDVLDYYAEIERFDRQLAQLLQVLNEYGRSRDTIVVVTSDHGMPFPRAKANLYDAGVRVPLAIRWPAGIPAGRTVDDFVSLADLAPTLLEAAGVSASPPMSGRSLLDVLVSTRQGQVDPSRDKVLFGREIGLGAGVRPGSPRGAPARALRTASFLYVRNYDVDMLPTYNPDQSAGPAASIMLAEKDGDRALAHMYELCFGRRPAEELYDCVRDPWQTENIAALPEHAATRKRLRDELQRLLIGAEDPRAHGKGSVFLDYPVLFGGGGRPGESVFLTRTRSGKVVQEVRQER